MKDNGYAMPPWELLSPAAAPPILTFDEPTLERISLASANEPQNDTYPSPAMAQPIGQMCSPEGQWNCMTTSFQRCASGSWSIAFPCAAGTICQPFGLTDYITIEYEPTANNGQADDGRTGCDHDRGGRRSFGLRNTPNLVLLFTALVAGVFWGILG
ncbi:uncharacterized protein TrAtP1_007818 [Trichoderma atroviride]|uniref:Uncharacterized protein n=1 Tax=Hypocrea atroviridis (strain ATCC 20476 / IMI 206040) TaxID=452589 RepID=G9NH56_HYPAI|nr:uncharacterized protein TRIATDRAFT_51158 [Trichoderma atroviride IMI 206040]EHK49951.1 hypothetical protein TRIATDRAFT_51158 [Trichoderma atroviride IMI 206040]UKZ66647.1 hypothetical protein TrAtP1_007818 [Trichoderma atroviride]